MEESQTIFKEIQNTQKESAIRQFFNNENLIGEIFCYLNYIEQKSLSLINRKANRSFNKKVKIVKIESDNILENKIYNYINKFKNLEQIFIKIKSIINFSDFANIKEKDINLLDLRWSSIENIQTIKNIPFKRLITLDLSNNNIVDISPLQYSPLINLKKLFLTQNLISDISVFKNVPFTNINVIYLCQNKIKDISVFNFNNLIELTTLNLRKNKIKSLDVLINAKFPKLKIFNISQNYGLSNILVLKEIFIPNLEFIDIRNTNIIDFNFLKEEYKNITIKL